MRGIKDKEQKLITEALSLDALLFLVYAWFTTRPPIGIVTEPTYLKLQSKFFSRRVDNDVELGPLYSEIAYYFKSLPPYLVEGITQKEIK